MFCGGVLSFFRVRIRRNNNTILDKEKKIHAKLLGNGYTLNQGKVIGTFHTVFAI
jgi:hypothetical protein